MSAKNVSYAEACREAIESTRRRMMREGSDYGHGELVIEALRSLAARLEQLTASLPPMPDGYALTDVGAREFLPPNVCIEFAAFCAAGFSPLPHALRGAPGATDQ